jgi:hypothetical protein
VNYFRNAWNIVDNYVIAPWQKRPSTSGFWYLPEPAQIKTSADLARYQQAKISPFYLIDYRAKLNYRLTNADNIIVLPYPTPLGAQLNPEAAFQYALGLHDKYLISQTKQDLNAFLAYAEYFLQQQNPQGLWAYQFNWYESKAPWYSALAQARGAVVMLRAHLLTQDHRYRNAASLAVQQFNVPTSAGGFLHPFPYAPCHYFEEYPQTPTGVLNGFMSCLMNIWELHYWYQDAWLKELWQSGLEALHLMLPFYSNGWWSLYDLDKASPLVNVNSPRYHLLEIHYLQILSVLSNSTHLQQEYARRLQQYKNKLQRSRALSLKFLRKVLYK